MRFCTSRPVPRYIAYLLILALVTACDRKPAETAALVAFKDARIVAIGWTADDLQWPGIRGGIERAAGRFSPLKVEYRAATDAQPATYAALIAEVELLRPHVAILQVGRTSDIDYAVRRLSRSGVRVVTVGGKIPSGGEYARVEFDLAGAAELLGEALPTIAEGGQAYVLVHERGADDEATRRYQRFSAGAEKHRLFQRLAERNRHESGRGARELIAEMLQEFRNVSLVVTLDAAPWRRDVPELLGPTNRFATLPASPALWGELRAGRCAALAGPIDGDAGAAALELAIHALSNAPRPESRFIMSELVTPATLEDFARRYRAAAGQEETP